MTKQVQSPLSLRERVRVRASCRHRGPRSLRRRGGTLVLFAVCMIPLIACTALAIDLGVLTFAETQLVNAADAAALAGARTLTGNTATNNNYSNVTPNAQMVVAANNLMGVPLTTSNLSLNIGRYVYNSSTSQFEGQFPGPSNQNWSLVQATVTANVYSNLGFAKVFSLSAPNLQATSTAAHRPRDICMILDYSLSMKEGTFFGLPQSGNRSTNNMDSLYPQFGHYAGDSSELQEATEPAAPYYDANISATTSDGRPPIIQDFYQDANGTPAFTYASTTYCTTPAGDIPVKSNFNKNTSYAQTVAQVLNLSGTITNSTSNSTFEAKGYAGYSLTSGTSGKFNGYTVGPGYWGKTFFFWPPDPTNDWRTVYFNFPTAKADNSLLWDNNGNWQAPVVSGSNGYTIDYTAILNFIRSVGPQVFPPTLQSGRIVYYSQIPTSINTSVWPPTDLNQRFWKDYIDYVLGVIQTSSNTYHVISNGNTGLTGYGADLLWGTAKITPLSSLNGPYMNYADNPRRPLLSFWFGPLTMIDFLSNANIWNSSYVNDYSRYNWLPGTCHEAPLYGCKLGIRAALNDIQNNHPNNFVSVIMFCQPKSSANDTTEWDRFNRVRVALGQDYTKLLDCLWYPPATLGQPTATVTPYDANNAEVPRAMGSTCYAIALMLAYNQFSSNASLQTYNTDSTVDSGDAGGNGRQGAQKIIIFETDGAPNTTASANFNNKGAYQSYYSVRYNSASPSSSEYPTNISYYADNASQVTSQISSLCTQLAAQTSAGGYSTASRPLLIHCIAFGPNGPNGVPTLTQMQQIGNVNDGMPSYKIINGDASTVISDLQAAIKKILQDGVQVSLIQ